MKRLLLHIAGWIGCLPAIYYSGMLMQPVLTGAQHTFMTRLPSVTGFLSLSISLSILAAWSAAWLCLAMMTYASLCRKPIHRWWTRIGTACGSLFYLGLGLLTGGLGLLLGLPALLFAFLLLDKIGEAATKTTH